MRRIEDEGLHWMRTLGLIGMAVAVLGMLVYVVWLYMCYYGLIQWPSWMR
jgi:hypothetical protein